MNYLFIYFLVCFWFQGDGHSRFKLMAYASDSVVLSRLFYPYWGCLDTKRLIETLQKISFIMSDWFD